MTEYRLLTYRENGKPAVGVLVGDQVYPAAGLFSGTSVDASSMLSLLETWAHARVLLSEAVKRIPKAPVPGVPLAQVELLAPILYPRAIFCAGANYWDHLEEMSRAQGHPFDRSSRPKDPWFFLKTSAHSVTGPGSAIRIPAKSGALDWEAELAVVIGEQAHEVPLESAADVIAGFTIMNDLSARDLMTRKDRSPAMAYDWIGQKCFPGSAAMGPWITPAEFAGDCANLSVRLWVNDVIKQDSNTGQMVHDVYEQISWLSYQLVLLPGDVIATGTPAGVGMPKGEYLQKGDVVKIEIENCGVLINHIR